MSTKTNFKRIALVAVAALGMGVLSSLPVNAATSSLTATVVAGTSSFTKSDSTTAATLTLSGLMEIGDSVTVVLVTKSVPSGSVPGVTMQNLDSTTSTLTNFVIDTFAASGAGNLVRAGTNGVLVMNGGVTAAATMVRLSKGTAAGSFNQTFGIQLDSATARLAGTYTYTALIKAYNAGTAASGNLGTAQPDQTISTDISIVVAAATSVSTTASAVYAFVNILSAAQASGSNASDDVISSVATASTAAGYIYVGNRNAANGASTAQDSITATVTGAGQVCSATLSAAPTAVSCGKSLKVSAIGDYQFILQGDGTAGSSSIVVSAANAGWSFTKSATFYALAAKTLAATVYNPTLAVGANSTAIAVTAKDASGTSWGGAAYIVASSAADALVGGSSTTPVACAYSSSLLTHFCPVTAKLSGTAKFKVIDAATVALATATSNEVTVSVSSTPVGSVKIAFNKATYSAGEKAYITVTALDTAGKTLQGQTFANLLAAGGISSSYGFASGSDTLTMTSITTDVATSATTPTTAGSKTYVVYMPSAGGTVKITATGGSSLPAAGQVDVTASATVSDSGAAALAAVTALATAVASLKTLITTLTNLVLKIQKKVKA